MPQFTLPTGVCVLRNHVLEAWIVRFEAGFSCSCGGCRQDRMSMGAVCGRYANRIADARLKHAALFALGT